MNHKIVGDGIATHNGEYWYKCTRCGASDWIASYGTKDQLNFYNKPCTQMNRNFDEFMNPQKYTNVADKIPELVEALARAQIQYATGRQYIGQVIALLVLLKDLIKQR